MPEVSRFYGIVVHIFYSDHAPPHFHAKYVGKEILVSIQNMTVLEGRFPPRALGMVMEMGGDSPGRTVGRLESGAAT